MRVIDAVFICGVVLGLSCSIMGRSTVASPLLKDPFYGISPQDDNYYKTSSDTIKCKDGSKKFSKIQLNDDFCDCPDGTDEPGTSACPNGKFYCWNAGHAPVLIFSSRVNDGICDCCDGSDEYDGQVKCPNTCWEAGKVARDKLKKKIATYQEGVTLRKKEVEKAKLSLASEEEELSKLKNEEKVLKGLVQQLKERKEQIEKAEEKERLQREKEEKENKEAEEKAQREKSESGKEANQENNDIQENASGEEKPNDSTHNDKVGVLEHSSKDQDMAKGNAKDHKTAEAEHVGTSENVGTPLNEAEQKAAEDIEQSASSKSKDDSAVVSETGHDTGSEQLHEEIKEVENDVSGITEELSREELGRLVASRWTGENTEKVSGGDGAKDNNHEELLEHTHDEEDDGYASDTDDEAERYNDAGKYDDHPDDDLDESYGDEDHGDMSSYKSDLDDELDISETTTPSSPSWLEKIQQTVRNLLQAVNLFQTPVDKSEAARIRQEYEESSAKLSKIQSRISSLTKKLKHDFGPEKEFYSFYGRCFESKQNKYLYKVCPYKQASQDEGHSSTRLGSWDKFEDLYRIMLFSNGDKCWNGPDRSLKVKLRCGLTNEVTDVDEPSRCEYVALLSTPALCLEEKLQELQHKLDLMNKEQPQPHDEL